MQLSKLQNVQHDPHQQNDFNNYPVIKRLITKWLGVCVGGGGREETDVLRRTSNEGINNKRNIYITHTRTSKKHSRSD